MKRLLSLVLSFSVALSSFSTVVSAAEEFPVTAASVEETAASQEQALDPAIEMVQPEVQTLAEETPLPEETPAEETAPTEAPAEETPVPTEAPAEETPVPTEAPAEETPVPTEAPVEETPATTEVPATATPTVTPSASPTAAPTATPSATPTPTPEATAVPTETAPAVPAQLAGEDVITMYYDAEAGVYYGRLPVEPNAEGAIEISGDYLYWSAQGAQYVVAVEDGSYWLFVMTGEASSEDAYLGYKEISAGETTVSSHAIVLGTGEPAQKPSVMVNKKDQEYSLSVSEPNPLVAVGGTADLSVETAGTILAVYGQNVEVVSGPDDQGNLTIRYPETVTSWQEGTPAVLWFYMRNSDGTISCANQQLSYVPGDEALVYIVGGAPEWYRLLNGGQTFQQPYIWIGQNKLENWSNMGTVLADQVTATLTDPMGSAVYSGTVTASYDAGQDAVLVSLSQLPEDLSVAWQLTIRVPCAEGYTLVYQPSGISRIGLSLTMTSSQLSLGLSAGSTYTGSLEYYDTENDQFSPMSFDDSWSAELNNSWDSVVVEEGKTLEDYFRVDLSGDSFTVTVLQDVTLKKASGFLGVSVLNVFFDGLISVPVGQSQLWWNSIMPSWVSLLSEEGAIALPGQEINGEYLTGWSNFGTVIPDQVSAALVANDGTQDITFTDGLTAVYDAEQDAVIVKAAALPENRDLDWTLEVTVPCTEGYNLMLSSSCGKESLSGEFVTGTPLSSLGLKAGNVQEGQVRDYDGNNLITPGSDWQVSLSSSYIQLGEGETLEDYLQVQVTESGTLRVEVLKDITLINPESSYASFNVQLENEMQSIPYIGISLGTASLNISIQTEDGYGFDTRLQTGSMTLYPAVYYNNTNYRLGDLGCQYQVQIYRDNQPYTGEFEIAYNDNGSFTLTLNEMPPLYNFDTQQAYRYTIGILSTDGSFADRPSVSQFQPYGLEINLYEDGQRVYSLPTGQGSHTYKMTAHTLEGEQVELPLGVQNNLSLALYADGNPVEGATLSVDTATATLTYTLNQDIQGSGDLNISGYWGDRLYLQGSVNLGKLEIQLDNSPLETNSSSFGSLGGRWKLSARATGAGLGTNLFFLQGSDLKDEGFEITATEDGQQVPIEQSKYFEASVESGMVTIRVKQLPPEDDYCIVALRYEDGSYTTGDYGINFSYQPDGSDTSSYYNPSYVDLETGKTVYNIPCGEPGTVDEYRVMIDGRYASDVVGSALSSFQLTNNAGLVSLDSYLKLSYNPTNSLLRLEWQDQPLPLLSEDGSTVYNYLLRPLDAEGHENYQMPSSYLFLGPSPYSLTDYETGQRLNTLEVQQGTTRKAFADYPLTGKVFVRVKNENRETVDSSLIQVSLTQYGALEFTPAASCPAGLYYLEMNGTYQIEGGTLVMQAYSLPVKVTDTPLNTVQYRYTLDNWGSYSMLGANTSLSFDKSAPNAKLYLTIYNNTATSFTIDGLTLGTAEAIPGGYAITMTPETLEATEDLSETLTLTATLANGSTEVTQVELEAPMVATGYRVVDGGTVYTTTSLFANSIWVVGKEYRIYPLLGGKTLPEAGVTLNNAFLQNEEFYTITGVNADQGYFTLVPVKAVGDNGYQNNYLYTNLMRANGDLYANQVFVTNGTNLANGARQQFINQATGRKVNALSAMEGKSDFALSLDEDPANIASIEYGTNIPDTLTWEQTGTTTVTLHVAPYIHADNNYFYAIITRKDGTMTSAALSVRWTTASGGEGSILPDGNQIYFGTKNEDASYSRWSASYYTRTDNATSTSKLYVFFGRNGSQETQYEDWPDIVKEIRVDSDSEQVTILRQSLENGMWCFEYQVDRNDYGSATITATVTLQDNTVRTESYGISICETGPVSTVTVNSAEQLQTALQSAALLPGTVIQLEDGVYEGNFTVDQPSVTIRAKTLTTPSCSADGTLQPASGVTLRGSIVAKADLLQVRGINFEGSGSGTALTDPNSIYDCTFRDYDAAVVLEQDIYSARSHNIMDSVFLNNGTALRHQSREWFTQMSGCTFYHNQVAVDLSTDCVIKGDYSTIYGATTTSGSMVQNRFYLTDGQLALQNNASNQATVNLSYNYFEQGSLTAPQPGQFLGPVVYSPYYETAECASITASDVLEDNVEEGTTTSVLTLVSGQGTSDTNTADSSLALGTGKFQDLQNSETVDSLQINVQSTSSETDVIWNFDKQDLNPDYAEPSVNLGVAFTFTDFEYDAIDQIVRKSTEDTTVDPDTGKPASETLGSIAYQAMCFAHSGPLPGTATVKVRMNESLLDYYASHGNSMDGFRIYYFNEDTGMLETMEQTIAVTTENNVNYMSFRVDHCSSYIVTNQELRTDVSGFNTIRLNGEDDGGYILADGMLDRVEPNTTVAEVLSHLVGGSMTVLNAEGNAVAETELMATDYTIGLGDGSVSPITVVVGGDVIPDGDVNVDDLVEVRRAVLEMSNLTGAQLKAGTLVSGDDRPNVDDLLQVRRYVLELITKIYEG